MITEIMITGCDRSPSMGLPAVMGLLRLLSHAGVASSAAHFVSARIGSALRQAPAPDRRTGIMDPITRRTASTVPAHPPASPAARSPPAPHPLLHPEAAAPRYARNRGTSPRTEHR